MMATPAGENFAVGFSLTEGLVQKAAAMDAPFVVGLSAPTALAVHTCEAAVTRAALAGSPEEYPSRPL